MSKTAAAKKSPAKAKPVAPPKSKNKVVAQPAVVKRAKVPMAAPGGKKVVLPPAKAVARSSRKPVEPSEPPIIKSNLPKKDLAIHRDNLLRLRDRIVDEIKFLANDSLNRSQKESSGDLSSHSFHMADQGTDNFDREFAANLLSSEQDVLYEIDEALRRIDLGTYGICEMSGVPIEKERLKFLPFARYSVAVQSEMERGKPRYRPFRRTSIQTAETQN